MAHPRNPISTVDIIIELEDGAIVLIERANPPYGWALPGGYVDYGESLESAAVREAKEETSLDIELVGQFHTYSDPGRGYSSTQYIHGFRGAGGRHSKGGFGRAGSGHFFFKGFPAHPLGF